MTHRLGPNLPQATRGLKYTAAALLAIAIPLGGAVLHTATETVPGGPSPTLAIPAPEPPQLATEPRSGGLASVQTTPSPDPTAEYEPEPAPAAVERVPPYRRPPTVVYVEVPAQQVAPTPQDVALEVAEPARKVDETQRGEDQHKRHHDRGDRHKRDKTTTPATETDGVDKPSEVCVVGVCVGNERESEVEPTRDSDTDDPGADESRDGDRSADRKKGEKGRS
jgi:hypothetical protein